MNAGASGVTTITYTYDAAGNRTQQTTTTSGDTAPTAQPDTVYTGINTPLTYDPRINDAPSNQYLTITATSMPAHGTIANGGTSLTYTPNSGYNGTDTFTYTISNGFLTSTATESVHVDNDPHAVNDVIMMPVNMPTTFNPLSNDSDPNGYGLSIISFTQGASGYVVNNGNGTLSYTPLPGFVGSDSFNYTISDGHNAQSQATVSVSVAQNPTANPYSVLTAENYPVTISLISAANDTDPANWPLTISATTQGSLGSVAIVNSGTQLTYTPNHNNTGSDSFSYTISNGHGGAASSTVAVTIASTPPTPTAVNDTMFDQALYTGGAGVAPSDTIDPRTNDNGYGFPLTIVSVTQGAKGTVTTNGTTVTYIYNTAEKRNFTDTDTFTYTVSNGVGGTSTPATVTVSIEVDTTQ